MDNYFSILNIRGLTISAINEAVAAATKVIEPDDIREVWLYPSRNMVYVQRDRLLPCVGVPHDFGTGAKTCQ